MQHIFPVLPPNGKIILYYYKYNMSREADHILHTEHIEVTSAPSDSTDAAPEASPDKTGVEALHDEFFSLATSYESLRSKLRETEKRLIGLRDITEDHELLDQLESDRHNLLAAIHENREHFLPVIYELQSQVGIAQSYELLRKWIAKVGGAGKFLEDWTEFGHTMVESTIYSLYMSSVSMLEEEGPRRTPSPYESILTTIETRKVANEICDTIKDVAVSVAQTGSGSWGAFFGMRGQAAPDPLEIDTWEARDLKMISDVDIIVVVETPQEIMTAISKLVENDFLHFNEGIRAARFKDLYESGRADIFSVRGNYADTEQSYHFIPKTVMEQITDRRPESNDVPVVNDYRPDLPGSFRKYGGYPILGVEGKQIALLKKDPIPVDPDRLDLGYISESPSGGPVTVEDGSTQFALGILSTQLLYQPDIMKDEAGFLRAQVDKLLANVAEYLPREEDFKVPRWDRMPKSFRNKLKSSLYERKKPLVPPEDSST